MFELNERLDTDTELLLDTEICQIRVMKSSVPWFVVVPKLSPVRHIWQLSNDEKVYVDKVVKILIEFLECELKVDNVNYADLANVVAQCHVHVVGRYMDDEFWSSPVWGLPSNNKTY